MKIGIDIMGGDFAPQATIGGAVLASRELPKDIRLCLFGDEKIIRSLLLSKEANPDNFEIFHAPDVIVMGEHPTKAFAQKPLSSISIGFEMLKKQKIDAFAGVGNSGAMLVGSIYSTEPIKGIIRPCISTVMPKEDNGVGIILDAGVNADCKPDMLYQFGILGSLYAKYIFNIPNPKVGLLNIGEEEEKGSLLTQSANKLMKGTSDFNFIGNVEPRAIFKNKVDVIVCDGFTGNIVLKYTETMYRLFMKKGFMGDFINRFNYEIYGGTPILGINGTVVVGHGISNEHAVKNMILLTKEVHEAQLYNKIKTAIESYSQNKEKEYTQ